MPASGEEEVKSSVRSDTAEEQRRQRVSKAVAMAQHASVLVEKLNSTNYSVWALRMQHYLKCESLWQCIEDPLDHLSKDEILDDEKALAAIVLSVDDQQLTYICDKVNARSAWSALREVYLQDSAGALIALSRRMYKTQMREGQSVRSHLDALADCFRQLELRGKRTERLDRIFLLLSSLPASFKPVISSLEGSDTAQLMWTVVSGRLLDYERRLQSRKPLSTSGQTAKPVEVKEIVTKQPSIQVPAVQQVSQPRKEDRRPEKISQLVESQRITKLCFICGSPEHMRKQCPRARRRFQQGGASQDNTWNAAVSSAKLVRAETTADNSWIIDSGAMRFFCRDEQLLHNVQSSALKEVLLTNGRVAAVTCRGSLEIPALGYWTQGEPDLDADPTKNNMVICMNLFVCTLRARPKCWADFSCDENRRFFCRMKPDSRWFK